MKIPLQVAYLCCECEHVVERAACGICGNCGSRALLSVSRVMNRQLAEKIAPEVIGPLLAGAAMDRKAEADREFLRGMKIPA